MSYRRAEQILPNEIIDLIQQYVDGECIYIPRKVNERQDWGKNTGIREELLQRNMKIYECFLQGKSMHELAEEFYLSLKSIQRIIREMKQTA